MQKQNLRRRTLSQTLPNNHHLSRQAQTNKPKNNSLQTNPAQLPKKSAQLPHTPLPSKTQTTLKITFKIPSKKRPHIPKHRENPRKPNKKDFRRPKLALLLSLPHSKAQTTPVPIQPIIPQKQIIAFLPIPTSGHRFHTVLQSQFQYTQRQIS